MVNLHFSATEHKDGGQDKLIFSHQIQPGPANQSYGIQVAQLAGLPKTVIQQARLLLQHFEQHGTHETELPQIDLELIESTQSNPELEAMAELVQSANLDEMTPREALELLYKLKESLQ